jgi:hypothetical protein
MIKAWNKNGKRVELDGDDEQIDAKDLLQFKMILAIISQECKEIITKVVIESDDIVFTVEQK